MSSAILQTATLARILTFIVQGFNACAAGEIGCGGHRLPNVDLANRNCLERCCGLRIGTHMEATQCLRKYLWFGTKGKQCLLS